MIIEKKHDPSATIAICHLKAGEQISAEGGAFMAAQGSVKFETTTRSKKRGGVVAGLKRMLGGESFFINHFTAQTDTQLYLGTPLPGDILVRELSGEKLIIQSGSYLASEPGIQIDLEWQGLKSVLSGEGLFWVNAKGSGKVLINSFGFIYSIDVDGEHVVDTGHIVAFEESLNFEMTKASKGWIDAFLSGEGLVCRFKGRGRVWCQSHQPVSFGQALTPHLRVRG